MTTITNTAVIQPAPVTIPNSNGGTTCTAWSTTASWDVPADARSGLYIGVLRRNAPPNNASFIPFVVRDDAMEADIIYKTSDMTWAIAYNYFGNMSALEGGKNFYGQNRCSRKHYGSLPLPDLSQAHHHQARLSANLLDGLRGSAHQLPRAQRLQRQVRQLSRYRA